MLVLLLACRPAPPAVEPASGPMSGYARLTFDLLETAIDPATVEAVRLGQNPGLELAVDDGRLSFLDQGSPVAGPVDLVVTAAGEEHVFAGAYTYAPPVDPVFTRFFAVGASLTQGVQGGVPSYHGQLHAPSSQLARAAGAYHPLALLRPGLFPELRGGDISPPPECQGPTATELAMGNAFEVLGSLSDPETGDFGFQHGRLDPDIAPQNLAIGGMNLSGVLDGSSQSGIDFVAHLMLDPYGGITDPVPVSQMELLEAAEPTLVISTDTFGNDVIGAFVSSDRLSLDAITPPEQMQGDIDRFVDRLAATGAEVFVANLPRPSLLPATAALRARAVDEARATALDAGEDPNAAAAAVAAEQDALIASVDDVMADYNAMLAAAVDRHANVHLVETAAYVASIEPTGIEVGGTTLGVGRFAGLLGTDGLHFSDTGYAMLANRFTGAIRDTLGIPLDDIDLDAVFPDDPYAPDVLVAEGLDPGCIDAP
ncbi:MAG: hypothetical protein H6737_20340 [Alphaproteobacteria bacterium]|nr:hypothetical protein [Alphaproteobacteria bacterium]